MTNNMDYKIKVRVCVGTHCYVTGNHKFKDIKDQLPDDLKDKVFVEGSVCLGCDKMTREPKHPYVEVNGTLIENATLEKIIACLRAIENTDNHI